MPAKVTAPSGPSIPLPLAEAVAQTPLVGREAALAELSRALAEGRAGMLTLVQGPPGIGKTRLVAELANSLVGSGLTVSYGRCEPRAAVPYEPFVQALRHGDRARLTRTTLDRLDPLLPAAHPSRGFASAANQELSRLALFDAVIEALRELQGDRRGLLILEDLHWAQESTLLLLAHLLRAEDPLAPVVVGTTREPDPDRGELLEAWVRAFEQRGRVRRVELEPLSPGEVSRVIGLVANQPVPETLARQLHEHTGGNPFVLRSTLTHLLASELLLDGRGTIATRLSDAASEAVPGDVLGSVRHRLDALEEEAQALLRAGAVLGQRFALTAAGRAAGLTAAQAIGLGEQAATLGLVRQQRSEPAQLEFDHALVRLAVLQQISPGRRALMHLAAAEAIAAEPSATEHHRELARHYGEALSLGTAEQTLAHALAAAELAGRQFAFDDVVETTRLALRALDQLDHDWQQRYELLLALGTAVYRAIGLTEALPVFKEAADLAERHHDGERIARAGWGVGLERYLRFAGVDLVAVELIERAYAVVGQEARLLAVRVRTARVLERRFLDSLAEAEAEVDQTIELARQVGDPEALLEAEVVRQVVIWYPTHTPELLANVSGLAARAREAGRIDLLMHLHCTAFGYALELNDRAELDAQFQIARGVADELRIPVQSLRVDALAITRALIAGELERFQSMVASWKAISEEAHQPVVAPILLLWSFVAQREVGDLRPVLAPLRQMLEALPSARTVRAPVAEVHARLGELEAARAELDVLAAERFADAPDDFLWLSVLTMSATTASLLHDRERAGWLYELLAPWAGRNVVAGLAAADRPVSHALGLLARTLGRTAEACEHFQSAADMAADFGATPWQAQALVELGATLRRRRSPAASRQPLREALELATRCGSEEAASRARRELVAAGGRPRRDYIAGVEGLTPSERQVAELAVAGHGNAAIAQTLGVTQRTVETHLTHVYRKLGIAGRGELGTQLGLHEPASS